MQGNLKTNVFVVHGRNHQARREIFAFLRALGLTPIEWSTAVASTGKASPFIGEVLETGFSIAQAVVILLTGDDEAKLKEDYLTEDDPEYEKRLTPQPRPNVLFEAGMAFGLCPERTILVELGKIRPFSDVAGRLTVRLNDTSRARNELAQRLENAGCTVSRIGNDWLIEGQFGS
jgi:predicted nucleotide-binding protein